MTVSATIAELNQLLAGTSITLLTLSTPTETITLHRQPGAALAQPPVPQADLLAAIAPCSGRFLHRHPLREAPLVQVGQAVQAGAIVGLLQVGPLLLHITTPQAGTVASISAEDTVGYGTPLVHLKK